MLRTKTRSPHLHVLSPVSAVRSPTGTAGTTVARTGPGRTTGPRSGSIGIRSSSSR
ncbi:hypothetical protein SLNWT_1141 [Streptomyces albus]|uniref:Uncharacterized protein n=1 Tax=Streptomyces albus (strain ATCC 21838 / DSM 41398 / FERM P-419 / JCM 4703 / NBRC 107858) TaxID=1081613 RepID=A0A0B5ETS8_STRA4|nr:hypothetical protein SLNWT_1141 [Streptomyces albus]AOU75832.1 hypothetical protein SLNHY_1141 [Streptomyces albus]AYN31638.1 hypothetical protein DUI70_1135 [Streptomyces albus]